MTLSLFVGGFALAALLGVYLPWAGWAIPAALVCLGTCLILRLLKRGRLSRPVLLGAALALLWLAVYGAVFHAPAQAMADRTFRMEAVAADWPEETDYGVRIPVRAGEADGRKVKALFYGEKALNGLRPGDRIACVAHGTPADKIRGEESLYYASRGILLQLKGYGEMQVTQAEGIPPRYALTILAGKTREIIDRLYPAEQAGFLHALLTGDKSGLDDVDQNNFNRVGLGHVVVISGLHVTFLVGFLSLFLPKKGKLSWIILVCAMVLFSLMTGNAPGTVRAAVLSTLALLAPRAGRSYHAITGLSAALLLLLAVNPYAIANAGLQFSFLSTAGIFAFGRPWSQTWTEKIPKPYRRWAKPFVGTVAISLGAMLFTVPLSALYFHRFSLIAPLSNLLTTWAVSLAFIGGLLSVVLGGFLLPLGQLLAGVVGLPIRYFLWYAEQASRLPLAAVTVDADYYALWALFAYGILLLYLLVPGKGKRPILPVCACVAALCLSAILTAKTVQRTDLTMTALDVGQGQSVALSSGNACALVDCGGSTGPGDTAATYLQSLGRTSLDLLVLTHFHADHAGGVPELLGRVDVKAIALPDVDEDSPLRQEIEAIADEQEISLHYITQTQEIRVGGAVLTLFAPVGTGEESNEQCLSVLCTSGTWDALLTGDMPAEGEAILTAQNRLPDLEVLVAGHHGSRYSTSERLLRAVTPETAVLSVGYNSYGHPSPETLDRLADHAVNVYRTDQMGTVTIYANSREAE